MRKPSGNVELIEVFAPDDAALWADVALSPTDQTPIDQRQSRRGVVLAGVVAIAAVIVGAIAFSGNDEPDSAPTTTVEAVPTTHRLPLDPIARTHFLIDDPSLTPYSADIVTPPVSGQQVQVWTNGTPTGPVVIIELHPHAYKAYGIVGAARYVIEGVELVRPIAEPDTAISEVAIDDDWSATVRASRLNDAEAVQVVSSVHMVDGELTDESDVMAALQLGLTFEAESLDDLIFGRVESTVRYLTVDGEVATLRSAPDDSGGRDGALALLTNNSHYVLINRLVGSLPDSGDTVVVWQEGGRRLSLVGPGFDDTNTAGAIDGLAKLSTHVRAASDDEWTGMLYGLRPDYTLGDFETLATGHAINTELWRAGPQIAQRDGRTVFLWWWTVPGLTDVTDSTTASFAVGAQPKVDTLVVPGATFVFVSHPSAGGTATVRSASGVEHVAELMQPFTQSTAYMTVVRIEEPGPVTVAIDGVEVEQ